MRHRRDRENEQTKFDHLQGLKAIRDTWYQFATSSAFDPEYMNSLERRIQQAEHRIRSGL